MEKNEFVKAFYGGKTLVNGKYTMKMGLYKKSGCFDVNITKIEPVETNDNFIDMYAGKDRHYLGNLCVSGWEVCE